jgi:hypothetical protein
MLFRSISSDEDGGNPANIAASAASNQPQRRSFLDERRRRRNSFRLARAARETQLPARCVAVPRISTYEKGGEPTDHQP